MNNPQELPLKVIWLVSKVPQSRSGKIIGPISMGSWKHHQPALLLSITMKMLGVDDTDDSFSPHRVYWVQGERFLNLNSTYEDQLVRRNDLLIVTDEENDDVITTLASLDFENRQNNRTGATDWSVLSHDIRNGH